MARLDQGGQVHGAYAQLVRRLGRVLDEDRVAGHPASLSLMDRSLEGWDRALAKAALRRGQLLTGLKPTRWALRTCYRLLHLAYDPREWWEHHVWDRRMDSRIPLREHEPTGKKTVNFLAIEQDCCAGACNGTPRSASSPGSCVERRSASDSPA